MKNKLGIGVIIITLVLSLGLFVAPVTILADGYSPLDLPPRGAGPSEVQGESTTSATPSATPSLTPKQAASDLQSGAFKRVQDGNIIVEVDGEERTVSLPEDVKVTRDGEEIALSSLTSGDTASFERNENGEITEVRVASQQSMSFWRGFLPILIVVLVGFYLLSRRAKRAS